MEEDRALLRPPLGCAPPHPPSAPPCSKKSRGLYFHLPTNFSRKPTRSACSVLQQEIHLLPVLLQRLLLAPHGSRYGADALMSAGGHCLPFSLWYDDYDDDDDDELTGLYMGCLRQSCAHIRVTMTAAGATDRVLSPGINSE
ncbi:hypothetical protein FQA47_003462 [Oryzias melastigma]|uniref:Uncharacterized protein n=1 Tax=Oryzias melastigma TaxID=30732 RepID=A0A834F0T2_ORYME|nr:hypothetical protein FQA47_003462 [Oryzias melastigma]